jgi:hypothetical protein
MPVIDKNLILLNYARQNKYTHVQSKLIKVRVTLSYHRFYFKNKSALFPRSPLPQHPVKTKESVPMNIDNSCINIQSKGFFYQQSLNSSSDMNIDWHTLEKSPKRISRISTGILTDQVLGTFY